MKVLFLEIDSDRRWALASIGPAFIGAYIRQKGHQVSFIRVSPDEGLGDLISRVIEERPDIIAFSLTSRQWLRARQVACELRKFTNKPIIAGGLQAMYDPEEVLASGGFDYVCLGEGEEAMEEVLSYLERRKQILPDSILNIWVRGGKRPSIRPPIPSIDSLPFMARDLLDEQDGVVHICTQRGCPFPCSYCAAANTLELYAGSEYGRRRSCQNVLDELVDIKRNGSLNFVIFEDDTFTIDRKWIRNFCQQYKVEVEVGFSINARVETMTFEMMEDLAAAGCQFIIYGVESGSYRVRKNIMNRPVANERFLEVFNWSKQVGIRVIANFMLGVPGETRQDMDATLDFIKKLEPDDFSYSVFYPFPGTALFKLCLDKGYLPEDYLELPANHRKSILNLPDLTQGDIAEYYEKFTAAREKNYLRQYGNLLNYETQQLAVDNIKKSAALG
jgi:radical SAM superfamily enzyme YgiQ (UPF0313 family)